MDKTTLVTKDLEIGGLLLQALSRAKIPVTLFDWTQVPELEEWQFIIATPWYDSRGPREANSRIIKALQDAGIYQSIPWLRVSVKSPQDDLVRILEQELRNRQEGAIHILEVKARDGKNLYSVIFAPFTGGGGAVPAKRLSGLGKLREFLEGRLYIHRSSVEEAFAELARKGNASIFHVQLTTREAKRVGLA